LKALSLNFSNWEIRTEIKGDDLYIFDPLRSKFVKCTPEEEVRQWLILYLCNSLSYPPKRIGVERQLNYNRRKKRFDLLVFDDFGKPLMLIETKRPNQKLNQKALDQISVYNHIFRVPYLCLFNGLDLICCKVDELTKSYNFISALPHYESLTN